MPGKYFQTGEDRARRVRMLFHAIARRYDLINDIQSFGLHRRWKSTAIRLSGAEPGHRVLDVCCGTGDLVAKFARRGIPAIGLDFTRSMLIRAAMRMPHRASAAPAFVCGDALQMPFPPACFDLVSVGYGLRNLADLPRGLGEIFRVLRPGGRLVVLDFSKPERAWLRRLYFGYLRLAVPMLGRVVCGDAEAYAYILESLQHFPGAEALAERLSEAGFQNTAIHRLVGGAMCIHVAAKP